MRERRMKKFCTGFGMGLAVFGLLCLCGLVVSLLLLGLKEDGLVLYASLCGGFAGGAAVFGLLGFFVLRRGVVYAERELDVLERADSEESFFVGEDTLARFKKESLVIKGAQDARAEIPYTEMRFFSVCARTKPCERGEWSVLMEFPARYLDKKSKQDAPPVLIQTNAKERLYTCLKSHALTLEGELPQEGKDTKRYVRMQKFVSPLPEKRKRALIILLVGAAAFCGGIGIAFLQTVIGTVVAFAGGYALLRGAISLPKARRTLAVYEEGIFLKEPDARESCFLKWGEIVRLRPAEGQNGAAIRVECPYGEYEFPRPAGAYEFLREHFPDKCEEC